VVVVGDVELAAARELLQEMWLTCFHAPIEALRKRSKSRKTPPMPDTRRQLDAEIARAADFFAALIRRLEARWEIDLHVSLPLSHPPPPPPQQQRTVRIDEEPVLHIVVESVH
jgi:hypothetical protein